MGASETSTATYDDMLAWYNKYLNKYLKSVKIDKSERSESTETLVVYLADGSAITFANYIYDVWVYIYTQRTLTILMPEMEGKNLCSDLVPYYLKIK